MNTIKILDSIRNVQKGQWNELAGNNAYASYGWLLTVEETFLKQVIPLYFLFQKSEEILGASVCYIFPKDVKLVSPDDLLFGRLKKIVNSFGISFMPMMVCYPFKAYGKHLFFYRNLDMKTKEEIAKEILYSIEHEAQKRNLALCFPQILKHEKLLIKQLCQRGYLHTSDLPQAYMDISWDSFEAYKKDIQKRSRNMKKNIVKEINKNRIAGVTISEVKDFSGREKSFFTLINNNSLKYYKTSLPFQENFLSRLRKNLGDDLVIYQSVKKGCVSGMGIMVKKEEVGCLPFIGIDYSIAQNDATYFNMLFYRPITDAINKNIKRIYFGAGPYYPKIRRGCKIQPAYFFYKPFNQISTHASKLWFHIHNFWYQKKLSHDLISNWK